MQRIAKWAGIAAIALVLLIAVGVGSLYVVSNSHMSRRYTVSAEPILVPTGAAAIAEGERIFISRGCVDCHGTDAAGQVFVEDPAAGHFAGANLTRGKGGIGSTFTDADFARAVRHGVAPDGRALIFMPSTDYFAMSDANLGALIAYLRSVPPVDKPGPEEKPGPISRALFLSGNMPYLVAAEAIDHTAKPKDVPVGLTPEFGNYMANTCRGCHGLGFSGGPIPGGNPNWPPAQNITPDPVTGLGKWSEADFIKAVREGVRPDGSRISPPMPWRNFSRMTDMEVKALWMYLKTAPIRAAGGR
jgi:mono/diheme cytochrome c family protein